MGRARAWIGLVAGVPLAIVACNSILGVEELTYNGVGATGETDASAGSSGRSDGGQGSGGGNAGAGGSAGSNVDASGGTGGGGNAGSAGLGGTGGMAGDAAAGSGGSSAACYAGQVRCAGSPATTLQQCKSDGTDWTDKGSCATEALCADTVREQHSVCNAPTCASDQKRCSLSEVQVCKAGLNGWERLKSCGTYGCYGEGAGTHCGVCTPKSRQCSGNAVQTCQDDGSWNSGTECGALEQCGPCGTTAACVAKAVSITGEYSIDATEVTRDQYAAWIATNPNPESGQPPYCDWNTDYRANDYCMSGEHVCKGGSQCGNHPQVCIDWCDAYAYCKAVGKRLCGRIGGNENGYDDYADASVSQWYNACSSKGANDYPYGDPYQGQTCNTNDNEQTGCASPSYLCTTQPVGALSACHASVAGYAGVYDLSGNVYEWEDSCTGATGNADRCRARGGSYSAGGLDIKCMGAYAPERFNVCGGAVGIRCCSS